MRKIVTVILALMLLSCTTLIIYAEPASVEESLIGIWKVVRISLDGEEYLSVEESFANDGYDYGDDFLYLYEFTEEGKMFTSIVAHGESVGSGMEAFFTQKDNMIIMSLDGNTELDRFQYSFYLGRLILRIANQVYVMEPYQPEEGSSLTD